MLRQAPVGPLDDPHRRRSPTPLTRLHARCSMRTRARCACGTWHVPASSVCQRSCDDVHVGDRVPDDIRGARAAKTGIVGFSGTP